MKDKLLQSQVGTGLLGFFQELDTRTVLAIINQPHHTALIKTALGISFSADGWLYVLLLPIIMLMKPEQSDDFMLLALAAFGFERCLYFLAKNLIRRRRPPAAIKGFQALIVASDRFSLPSGHTSAAFLFVTFLCFGISWLFFPLYLWAIGVGFSRVILGVHFPTDIVLGALLGTGVALTIL